MRCLVDGHTEIQVRGYGKFADHVFRVCAHCNKPLDTPEYLAEVEERARAGVAIQANAVNVNGESR